MLVKVSVSDELLPRITLPKLRLVGAAVNAPGASPVPDKDIVKVGFDAFDVIVTVPLALPPAVGAKATLKVVFCAGFSVTRMTPVVPQRGRLPLAINLPCGA